MTVGPPWLVVFDCDGTLIDSQHSIVAAMDQAFDAEGLTPPNRLETLGIVGLSLREAMAALRPDLDGAAHGRLADAYRAAFTEIRQRPDHHEPMYDGVPALLERLRAREDVLLGIATGKARRGVNRFLEREGLEGAFHTIQTADDAPSKPHPAMLHQAMSETGAHKAATLMIGDTAFDIVMARSAGVTGIAVTWGYHDEQTLVRAEPHDIVHGATPLVDVLAQRIGPL